MSVLEELRANGGMTNGLSDDFNKWPVARSFAQLARELASAKEKMAEKEEEVGELKSERTNTRVRTDSLSSSPAIDIASPSPALVQAPT